MRHVVISPDALFAGPCSPAWQQKSEELARLFAAQQDVLLELEQAANPDLSRGDVLSERLAAFIESAGQRFRRTRSPPAATRSTRCSRSWEYTASGCSMRSSQAYPWDHRRSRTAAAGHQSRRLRRCAKLAAQPRAAAPIVMLLANFRRLIIERNAPVLGRSRKPLIRTSLLNLKEARFRGALRFAALAQGDTRRVDITYFTNTMKQVQIYLSLQDQLMSRPIIAITMGDPAGVGPEIIMKSLAHADLFDRCRPLVIGDAERLRQAGKIVGVHLAVNAVATTAEGKYTPGTVDVIDIAVVPPDLAFGKLSPAGGEAAYRFVECAAKLALAGEADAICTAPLNKEALHVAGHIFPGHTEMLAHLTGTHEVSMMLVAPKLRVIHVTTHIGLIDAIAKIKPGLVERTIARAHDTLVKAGIAEPAHRRLRHQSRTPASTDSSDMAKKKKKSHRRFAHAVERGWKVEGPLPADTLFFRAARGDFDWSSPCTTTRATDRSRCWASRPA